MKKPHIVRQRIFGDWICVGEHYVGIGKTPAEAYERWSSRPFG